jgi:hypothetical protein
MGGAVVPICTEALLVPDVSRPYRIADRFERGVSASRSRDSVVRHDLSYFGWWHVMELGDSARSGILSLEDLEDLVGQAQALDMDEVRESEPPIAERQKNRLSPDPLGRHKAPNARVAQSDRTRSSTAMISSVAGNGHGAAHSHGGEVRCWVLCCGRGGSL